MSDLPEDPIYTQSPYFDFIDAVNSYGFDWDSFKENNFSDFIEKTFILDFIEFRKSYIKRDYHEKIRKLAHKFKGSFSVMRSTIIQETSNNLKVSILTGEIEISDLYADLVNAMISYLEKLISLSKQIGNPISQNLIEKFQKLNKKCDDMEDRRIKIKLQHITPDPTYYEKTRENFHIEKDSKVVRGCCTEECIIF